jgi:hypothetical protein
LTPKICCDAPTACGGDLYLGTFAMVIIRPRGGSDGLKYTVPTVLMPKLVEINKTIQNWLATRYPHEHLQVGEKGSSNGSRRTPAKISGPAGPVSAGRTRSLSPLSSAAVSMSMLEHHNATVTEHLDAFMLSLLMLA